MKLVILRVRSTSTRFLTIIFLNPQAKRIITFCYKLYDAHWLPYFLSTKSGHGCSPTCSVGASLGPGHGAIQLQAAK